MRRALWISTICLLMAGCEATSLVRGPAASQGGEASTGVEPLSRLVSPQAQRVKLIMIHGVGDHCPGYALKNEDRWLDDRMKAGFGLTGELSTDVVEYKVVAEVFQQSAGVQRRTAPAGPPDQPLMMHYATQSFVMRLPGHAEPHSVDAVEVTWSPLTQWIKTRQLGYDGPADSQSKDGVGDCQGVKIESASLEDRPPKRAWLSATLKEDVLDRNLADAIIYVGSYCATIERGVADVLCRVMASSPPDPEVACAWPTEEELRTRNDRFVFVTHSLGSRILYDVILHLSGYETTARGNPFAWVKNKDAQPAIAYLLRNTDVIYMMSNQLALLGLAYMPPEAVPGPGPVPYKGPGGALKLPIPDLAKSDAIRPLVQWGDVRRASPAAARAPIEYGDVFSALAAVRAGIDMPGVAAPAQDIPPLRIIAFNDANDLLTWHVPRWYVDEGKNDTDRPRISLSNLFVKNGRAILFSMEHPSTAHSGYFRNRHVWRVVACGIDGKGEIEKPCGL
jgi:hypothetical protein